jgi:antitoxin (DNA-binding transcriptional repressor) of toxin-antitoxin stability system
MIASGARRYETVFVVSKTQLRNNIGLVDECLKRGERLIITSYGRAIGIITPDIPEDIGEKVKLRDTTIPFAQL